MHTEAQKTAISLVHRLDGIKDHSTCTSRAVSVTCDGLHVGDIDEDNLSEMIDLAGAENIADKLVYGQATESAERGINRNVVHATRSDLEGQIRFGRNSVRYGITPCGGMLTIEEDGEAHATTLDYEVLSETIALLSHLKAAADRIRAAAGETVG